MFFILYFLHLEGMIFQNIMKNNKDVCRWQLNYIYSALVKQL